MPAEQPADRPGAALFREAQERRRRFEFAAAIENLHLAERLGYDADQCAAARWDCHMRLGHLQAAWQESDAIARRGAPDPHRLWDGQPCDGKNVVVRCLHGLGDTIQFIRYAERLRARARSVTVEAPRTLMSLLRSAPGVDRVITWEDKPYDEPTFDQQLESMELPRAVRPDYGTVPARFPYLWPSQQAINNRPLGTDTRPRIGLVWESSEFDVSRSIPCAELAAALPQDECVYYGLQFGAASAQIDLLAAGADPVRNLVSDTDTVERTAAAIVQLDLIITVDTMVAHLAGALARPVWTLLPYYCDWRWRNRGERTDWYPTMRLFRQRAAGEWTAVTEAVREALRGWLEQRSQEGAAASE